MDARVAPRRSKSSKATKVDDRKPRKYKKSNHKTKVIWIDFYGNPRQARKLARLNHLTFPVVVHTGRAMTKAWAIQAAPEWVLLDSRGRVIEARLKPQTVAQLTSMLADGRASR